MPPVLLQVLTWFLLVLLWLFFLRAMRAVLVEVRWQRKALQEAAEDVAASAGPQIAPLKLRIVEPRDQEGRSFELTDELTVGRAPGCGVPLVHDTFASSLHARIYLRDRKLWVEDLDSTNGTFLNERDLVEPAQLRRGDVLQVGNTLLEVYR